MSKPDPKTTRRERTSISLNLNVRSLKPSATLAINEHSQALIDQGRKVYRMGFGQSPFPVPDPVVRELQAHAQEKDYLPVKGLWALREAVAESYRHVQGIDATGEDVLIGPGSKELLFILQLVYYGDLVIPTPSWVSYSPQAQILGRNVQWVRTTAAHEWRLTLEELEQICSLDPERPRLVILNYPANPTGATYTVDKLKRLAQVARKYKVILLSDEIYGELHHQGQHVSVARYYPEGTIISSGLSKWCGAGGWRLGTFTFPKELRWLLESMAVVASETFTATSAPIQYAAVAAFKGGEEIEQYLRHARRILGTLGRALQKRMQAHGITMPTPYGGFYLFPNFEAHRPRLQKRGINTNRELCDQLLEDTGVALLPSQDFGRPAEELTARLSYVNFDGAEALEVSREQYPSKNLDEAFLRQCCPESLEAIDLICQWAKH